MATPADGRFLIRAFYPKAPSDVSYPSLPDQVRGDVVAQFRRELLKPQYNPLQIGLDIRGYPALAVSLEKVQHTAGIAQWIRNVTMKDRKIAGGILEAVTLYLTGIDKAADDEAINKTQRMTDPAGTRLAHPASIFDKIRAEIRPVAATLGVTPTSGADPSIKLCMECLAQAFFDQFGVISSGEDKK